MKCMVVFSSQAYVLTFIGLMISLGGALFAYLISTAGGFPQLKGWAQKEFKELIFSALIIFFGMFLLHHVVLQICGVLIGYPGPLSVDNPIYFTQAKTFLKILDMNIQDIATKGVMMSSVLLGYSEYGVTMGVPIPIGGASAILISGSITPLQGLSLIGGTIADITKTVVMTNFLISVMDSLLYFIQTTSFTIFFPMGIIFRSLPITRKLGSTIIALSICFYFVFPMTILFNQFLYVNMFLGDLSYDNEHPESLTVLQDRLGQKLENESQIENNTLENITDISFDFGNEYNESIIGQDEGDAVNDDGFIKKFFSTIRNFIDKVKDLINNTLNNILKETLNAIIKPLTVLARAGLGINLNEFIGEPMHYTVALANSVLQKFVFILFCLFLDVIFCLTLFSNISGVLGGETKIFGIEKLKLG